MMKALSSRTRVDIDLPGAEHFNGALLQMKDGFYLIYRSQEHRLSSVPLDFNYVPTHSPRDMGLHCNIDPRPFVFNGAPYMLTRYTGGPDPWRMELWKLGEKGRYLETVGPHEVWDHIWPENETLFLQYCPWPLTILQASVSMEAVECVSVRGWTPPPEWMSRLGSNLRGNTNPVELPNGDWLTTFHQVDPNGSYYTGFLAFHSDFSPFLCSRRFELGPEDTKPWVDNPRYGKFAAFPLSMQIEGDLIRLCGGSNGHRVTVWHFSLEEVLSNMEPV
jgi:hypothetical protein